jgi:acyl carrier protein
MTRLLEILQSIRPEFDFSTSDDFIADGLLDSFDVVTLVATLDRTYGISIDGVEIIPDHFRNIQSITALLGRYGVRT